MPESQIGKLVNLLREQAQKLEEDKTVLQNAMADLSHQLKTPMTSLHLIVAMLADEELDQSQRLGYVEHSGREGTGGLALSPPFCGAGTKKCPHAWKGMWGDKHNRQYKRHMQRSTCLF